MAGTTYRSISEVALTTFYRGVPPADAKFRLNFVAQVVAEEIAAKATRNAFENSNSGETTFSNDMFISTYTALPVLYDSVLKVKYTTLPATPAALPNNQEIQAVIPNGARNVQVIPIKNKDRFMQNFLPKIGGVVLYYIQNNRIVYDNFTEFSFGSVNINMIGSIPSGTNLLDTIINCPKNYESEIVASVVQRLMMTEQKPRPTIENLQTNPN